MAYVFYQNDDIRPHRYQRPTVNFEPSIKYPLCTLCRSRENIEGNRPSKSCAAGSILHNIKTLTPDHLRSPSLLH